MSVACGPKTPENEILEVRVFVRPEDARKGILSYDEASPLREVSRGELYRDSNIPNDPFEPKNKKLLNLRKL
ncbi:MAG TPA: hypothetical protein PKX91_06590 [Clostridia bacterium]|jgi:hypothetical protein|nr:hypothetical protein [Clostridia bacterium]